MPSGRAADFDLLYLCRMFKRFSDGVATSREGQRSPKSDPEVQHRRWGRVLWFVAVNARRNRV
jgi:hypothetical protein